MKKTNIIKIFSAFLPGPLLRFWGGFLYLLLLMSIWRFGFLLYNTSALSGQDWWLYIRSFYIGLRLDAVIAAYFMIPFVLTMWLAFLDFSRSLYSKLLIAYLVFITAVLSTLSVIDILFFEEFNSHMNLLVLQDNVLRRESVLYLWQEYPLIKILLLVIAILWGCNRVLKQVEMALPNYKPRGFQALVSVLVTLAVFGTSIRGGWQERPIDWGHAIFSESFIANQIALNGIFFLGRSVVELRSEKNLRKSLEHYPEAEALQETRSLIISSGESFVDAASLERIRHDSTSIRPNIMLVVLESHTGSLCGYLNPDEQGVTPVLDSLARSGIAFTRCFANGKRSAFGMSSILMSWPVLPGLPLISQLESSRKAPSIAKNLEQIGYRNIFLYGGDSQFDNMRGFALANGFDQVIDERDLPSMPATMWGIFDHHIFNKALHLFDEAEQPLQLTLFTTSNHQPWTVPADYVDRIPSFPESDFRNGAVHRTMAYVDMVLGEFMQEASSRPWFENTLFIFVADHGLTRYRDTYEDLRNGHIPWVMYGPAVLGAPQVINTTVSQIDIMPTLFGVIGYPKPFVAMGRDVLASPEGYMLRISNDYFTWLEDDHLYGEILGQRTDLYHISDLRTMSKEVVPQQDDRFNYYKDRFGKYLQTAFLQFKAFGD